MSTTGLIWGSRVGRVLLGLALIWLALPEAAVRGQQATPDAPVAVELPRDEGPHAVPMEWWYFTGHLFTEDGDRYGFELVVFKADRGGTIAYASHAAVTDNVRGRFRYDQRLVAGEAATTEAVEDGFDFRIGGWRTSGADGDYLLAAGLPDYAFSLRATSEKPPALHDGDGYIDYGNGYIDYGDGQWTYYYSRTRLAVSGSLAIDGEPAPVTGLAWMDHQWGDFTTYEDGGWDWFSLQLDDGWDLMLYLILTPDGTPRIVDGSLIAPDGSLTVLEPDDFSVTATGTWTSPATGTTYPSGWEVEVPAAELVLQVTPALVDQELDTTASTGQIYWEGEVAVAGTRADQPLGGLGYVELTDYADRSDTAGA